MALITCPQCGEKISDKSKTCIHCGYDLSNLQEPIKLTCPECGAELEEGTKICPNCGYPLEEEEDNSDVESSSADLEESKPQQVEVIGVRNGKKIAIIAVAVIAVIAIVAFAGTQIKKQRDATIVAEQSADYKSNLSSISSLMLSSAADAETAGNLIKNVWSNCINKKSSSETDKYTKKNSGSGSYYDDFNDALSNLFSDKDFTTKIAALKMNQNAVMSRMKDMTNPPDEWAEAYKALQDFYDAYITLTNLAISPSGSLMTYSSNFNNADSEVLNTYQKLQLYLK